MSQAAIQSVPTVSIYGIRFSKLNMTDTVQYLINRVERREPTQVITGNPIMVMAALEQPNFHRVMCDAELVVPDGTGVVWAAKHIGQPVTERVAGYDLLHRLMQIGEQRSWRVFLLGTTQAIIEQTAIKLQEQYPGVTIVGYRNGYFGPDQDEEVVQYIRASESDLLFVARSVDTQEPWISKYKEAFGVPVIMGVGGSFDVISGNLKRAPKIFQKMRMEWLYRLLQQPSRYKRMFALPKFVVKVMRDKENVGKHRPTT
ncbi:acetylglucosaminyldiphosphoundecaprenol acetyl-beta-D-mannosaminyltransferase [Paenibacillus baekrokdamisoli]|uniref:N-acetylglucosaminyldiphosphoundecaprenol N-acetyl-beta-D-mannosaminyltransferase n=1 Tax=Paenibacillus baekrokdamisoli TaxID=1712516 RepID=A0A3G9IYA3_9BACL|nr:WecB/TagA/CpsF family glycosyltransferase [Paenibacillus baekrokdamisoli]BBH23887.1 acetylglucosaminyldiphosphoundecaprenol acetyl-beta-D-mannosaminyltransferase [Paenibacillus baekrokdamisoli]